MAAETKSIIKSKTVGANVLIGMIFGLLEAFGVTIPSAVYQTAVVALPVVNVVLRLITKDKVTLFSEAK